MTKITESRGFNELTEAYQKRNIEFIILKEKLQALLDWINAEIKYDYESIQVRNILFMAKDQVEQMLLDENTTKFIGHICTDNVGSKVEFEFEVPNSEIEGKNNEEKIEIIDNYCKEEMWNHANWGYKINES